MIQKRKPIEQVFTPRNESINPRMYIPRDSHERALQLALKRQEHVMIFGEPGTGKSWLYKRVLGADTSRYWTHVNLANAQRSHSVVDAINLALADPTKAQKVGYSESKSADVGAVVARAGINHAGEYAYEEADAFLGVLRRVRSQAGKLPAILVLDNLEWIFGDPDLLKELGSLIVLVDDPSYAALQVKLIIVGVPSGIREYFANVPNMRTVSTRIRTIPEVAGFTKGETDSLIERGFSEELQVDFTSPQLNHLQEHVFYITLGIPLYVHDYCRELATVMADHDYGYDPVRHIPAADKQWLVSSLDQSTNVLLNLMNSRQTRVGRKNQLLYTLGRLEEISFDAQGVETRLRMEFRGTTHGKTLNIGGMLSEMEAIASSPISRIGTTNRYRFTDPKFRMCMRALLQKGQDETVEAALLRE